MSILTISATETASSVCLSALNVRNALCLLKFKYSEKATKFCEIFTLLLSYVVPVKSKVKISQNVVAFSEYMNFTKSLFLARVIFIEPETAGKPANIRDVVAIFMMDRFD